MISYFLNQTKLFRIFSPGLFTHTTVQVFQAIPPVLKLVHFVQSAGETVFWCCLQGRRVPCSSCSLGYLSIDFKNTNFLFLSVGARSSGWTHPHHVIMALGIELGHATLSRQFMRLKLLFNDIHVFAIAYLFAFVIFNIILLQLLVQTWMFCSHIFYARFFIQKIIKNIFKF